MDNMIEIQPMEEWMQDRIDLLKCHKEVLNAKGETLRVDHAEEIGLLEYMVKVVKGEEIGWMIEKANKGY